MFMVQAGTWKPTKWHEVIPKDIQDLDSLEVLFSDEDTSDDENDAFDVKKGHMSLPKTFSERLHSFVEETEIPLEDIAPVEIIDIEPWTLAEPEINLNLSRSTKEFTLNAWYISEHKAILDFYSGFTSIYTDGSKVDEKVAAAATWEFGHLKTRLPNNCTIFSAEAVALSNALKIVHTSLRKRFIIFTDSLSCLESIQNEDLNNPLIQNILKQYTQCIRKRKRVVLCWVPGHVGIDGNTKADRLAKEALNEQITPMQVPYTDFLPLVKDYFQNIWQERWSRSVSTLSLYAFDTKQKIFDMELTRKEQVNLTRVRIGHTHLTHSYHMNKGPIPVCDQCGVRLNMIHIMVECPKFDQARTRHLQGSDPEEIFSNSDRNIIQFLKDCDIFRKI
jgi:ribonuclease HI